MSLADHFQEHGYAVARSLFSPDETAALESEFDRIVAQISAAGEAVNARWSGPEMDRMGAAETVVLHTHNVQRYSAAWMQALLHPRFLAAGTEILGPDVILHHTKLFQKPAEMGSPFPMHQDWEYFPSELDTMLAAVIHLSPATDEMGCLRVYPGSHRIGRVSES
ncbi:MAG: phytanoyl-CoA dioxygenase family protein, partial [Fimbriimonadaceae bacterium]|nr:phytanoyl-CoA dioxygenase family protein [Fimbriimonadaceae bacterium]